MRLKMVVLAFLALLLPFVYSQETLTYTIREESGDLTVGDIIRDSGLDQEYTQDDLNRMNFVFVESDEAHENLFNVRNGVLETKAPVDRDNICPHLEVCVIHVAIKIQPSEFFAIVQVEVVIVDQNDNVPTFQTGIQEVIISESTIIGALSNLPQAQDNDSPTNSVQGYEMTPASSLFSLHQEDIGGIVRVQLEVRQQLDREQQDTYSFTLLAYDGGDPAQSSSVEITIKISDSNDNRPVFLPNEYEINVLENSPVGFSITQVSATDSDLGQNAVIEYSFDDNTLTHSGHIFHIDSGSGEISLREQLDYETAREHTLIVLAKDNDPSYAGAAAEIKITVIDYNDNRPNIKINDLPEGQMLEVPENEALELFVAHVTVTDEDSVDNGDFECSLESEDFVLTRLHPTEFKIITDVSFDRERRSQYTIRMTCLDNGSPRLENELTIPVIISDKNDQIPTFQSTTFVGNTLENAAPGTFIMRVTATDEDIGRNSEIEYHIDGLVRDKFNIGLLSGNISAQVNLDHEFESRYTFIITAVDRGEPQLSSTATVIIDIVDVDDNAPIFNRNSYTFSVPEHESPNTAVGTVHATDADSEPFNYFQYSIQENDMFWIDSSSGEIYMKLTLDREEYDSPVFATNVYAVSSGFRPTTSTALVTVHISDINDHAPVISFPNPTNNTLSVSSTKRRGDVIGYVSAVDGDDGNNARLTYSFVSGNQDNYFFIDAADGTIVAHQSLSSVNNRAFGLMIRVSDDGSPPLSAEAYVNIIVNKSETSNENDSAKKTNLSIVLSIACISGVIIVILIIAIAFIIVQRRRQHQRNRYSNVPKVLNSDAFKQIPPATGVVSSKHSNQLVRSFDNSGYSEEPARDQKDNHRPFKQRENNAPDSDQDSICSADISNTDSGRGSNEDFSHDKIRPNPEISNRIPNTSRGIPTRKMTSPSVPPLNASADGIHISKYSDNDRLPPSYSAINKEESYQIRTANLQSGAYPAGDQYRNRRSFNSKNVSHPSPLLDDPLYGDRRRHDVLYRDISKVSNHTNSPSPFSHHHSDPGKDYVMLRGVGASKGVLHEVHV